MCGIIGAISKKESVSAVTFATAIDSALEKMAYRGPDNKGSWHDNQTYLGHRRLSIIDLSENGNQPFSYEGGQYIVVFNGEVYNYQELRFKLIGLGYSFKTGTDTEVLLAAYKHYGDDFCKELRGMFAFALYDLNRKKILFSRDRLGKKPLFIYEDGDTLIFASEIKFFHAFDIKLEINPTSLKNFLSLQYVPGPATIYKNVRQVKPAEISIYDLRTHETQVSNYWNILDYVGKSDRMPDAEEIDHLILNSIRYRLVANVDIGLLLSGGIDSSLLACYMEQLAGKKVKAFNVGFSDDELDESVYAREVASALGLDLITLNFQDVKEDDFIQSIFHADQPLGDSAIIPTYLISKAISQHVKVVLSGEGADELFHGYKHYELEKYYYQLGKFPFKAAGQLLNTLSAFAPGQFDKIRNKFASINSFGADPGTSRWTSILSPAMTSQYLNHTDVSTKGDFDTRFSDLRNEFRKKAGKLESSLMLDLITWLPDDLLVKTDRMMMASSVEARTPFLDHTLVERVVGASSYFQKDAFRSKNYLRRLLKSKLPDSISEKISNRPKQGFETPKIKWINSNLSGLSSWLFSDENLASNPFLNKSVVTLEWKKFKEGSTSANNRLIWNLFCFLEWYRQHTKKFGFK